MLKYIAIVFAVIGCVAAKPGILAPLAYSAPGVVTATSSQVVARNFNGIAAAPVVAAPLAARYVASPLAATPVVAAPLAARYVASPFAAPLAAAPLAARYATLPLSYAAPAPVLL